MYITICKIDIQWKFVVWLREPKLGYMTTKRGGMEWERGVKLKRQGTYVYLWLIHVDVINTIL